MCVSYLEGCERNQEEPGVSVEGMLLSELPINMVSFIILDCLEADRTCYLHKLNSMYI